MSWRDSLSDWRRSASFMVTTPQCAAMTDRALAAHLRRSASLQLSFLPEWRRLIQPATENTVTRLVALRHHRRGEPCPVVDLDEARLRLRRPAMFNNYRKTTSCHTPPA